MIKILHVISDKNIGGSGRLLLNLLAEADREKFHVSVALPHGSMLTKRIEELNVEATETELSLSNLRRLIKDRKPDVVHTHSAAVARVAARLCGVRVTVNTKHCAEEVTSPTPILKRIPIRAFDALFTDHTIATAEYARERLVNDGIPARKTSVIINGSLPLRQISAAERASARARLGYTDKEFIAIMAARLERGKGQEYFIEAARICQKNHPEIKFLIAGDGSMRGELEALAQGLDNLKFLGFVADVSEIMNIADTNVNCSYISETSSLSLSEGMSVGAVPIVSDCGGNAFMAGGCGIVVPKRDANALAEALIDLADTPNKLKALERAAKQKFSESFTAQAMTKKTEALYLSKLQSKA